MKLPLPPFITLLSILIAILLHVFLPVTRIISYPYNLLGVLIIALGVYLFLSAAKIFGWEKTDIHPKGRPSFFIKRGPYRFSRNPIYLAMITAALGVAVLLGSSVFPLHEVLADVVGLKAGAIQGGQLDVGTHEVVVSGENTGHQFLHLFLGEQVSGCFLQSGEVRHLSKFQHVLQI